ncbi:MAG: hypothetical protein JSU63_07080 [Phycisphaerales bacterium]|nr:MAG: hypothetical protein JSU63_07080 [Phycisphaerales bacterium]
MTIQVAEVPVKRLFDASRRIDVIESMSDFYAECDRLIAEQPGRCVNKGECCRFGEYGHRLYVTALEVCYYLARTSTCPQVTEDACPQAYDQKCYVRDSRPLGCRIFFCDPAAQQWQGPLTEELLARLRDLHRELDVPYFYVDWMTVVRALGEYTTDARCSSK